VVGGSNGAICGLITSKMAADGHLGMMALSRVTFASAGLSCINSNQPQLMSIAFCYFIVCARLVHVNMLYCILCFVVYQF